MLYICRLVITFMYGISLNGDVGLPRKEKDRDEKTKGDKEKKTEKHRDVGGA